MVRLNWTFQAREDLKNIADYISIDSVRYAKFQVVKIRNRTNVLKQQIQSGKVVIEINDIYIREVVEGNYRIIYKVVSDNQIDILAVHHSARDLKRRSL